MKLVSLKMSGLNGQILQLLRLALVFHGLKSNISSESEVRAASLHVVVLDQAFLPGNEGNNYLRDSSIAKFVFNKMRHISNKHCIQSEELVYQPNLQESFP